jgi:hypothetical protein
MVFLAGYSVFFGNEVAMEEVSCSNEARNFVCSREHSEFLDFQSVKLLFC